MDITKKRLKKIIQEEMIFLAENGDISLLSESEREVFKIILEKLSEEELEQHGLKRVN